ncbi:zinc metalloproteinase nas-36-like [Liolophura sinensis]|uniref:zinc metalloproteinase nas-36-like n=1 Tax=Liolophura sinensis TaxID=3198878 RepID=UPI0031598195
MAMRVVVTEILKMKVIKIQYYSDHATVAGILDGETVRDKVYIFCRMAHARIEAEKRRGRNFAETQAFDVEKSLNYQGDIRLNLDTVDKLFSNYQSAFLKSNGRTIPRLSTIRSFQRVSSNAPGTRSLPKRRRNKRKILSDDFFLWTNAEVNYKIESTVTPESVDAIRLGIEQWEQHTCLRFIEHARTDTISGPHIKFAGLDGCWSLIGQQASGQTVSIGVGCEWAGIASHEIGHALGFYHEQSRPDRDSYVKVNFNNIQFGLSSNFDKTSWESLRTSGVPYDYSSVMHYGPTDFSFNGKPTVESLDKSMESVIGQREGLTFSDITVANINYCSRVCGGLTLDWDQCQNGGYRSPNNCNECICPKGFSPPFCESPVPGVNANCGQTELTASSDYKFLASPGFSGTGYNDNSFCAWKITAPAGQRVMFEFVDQFEYDFGYLNVTCDTSYVEVRRDSVQPGKRGFWRWKPDNAYYAYYYYAYACAYTCAYACAYTCAYARAYPCTYACAYTCAYPCAYYYDDYTDHGNYYYNHHH